jgi:hypothetical protein
MFYIIVGVVVGVVALGWVYHRYTTQTQEVLDKSATAVNTVINDVKDQVKK